MIDLSKLANRRLKTSEIEVRIGQVFKEQQAVGLLLYKDARCDMNILDEIVGAMNWQREHYQVKDSLFCRVGIKVGDEWVWKADCGVESNTEAQKGEASDSFKRACVNWGIGRELYTAPFIYVPLSSDEWRNGYPRINISVSQIEYDKDKAEIVGLELVDKQGVIRYSYGTCRRQDAPKTTRKATPKAAPKEQTITELGAMGEITLEKAVKLAEGATDMPTLNSVWQNLKGQFGKETAFVEAIRNNPNNKKAKQ